MAWQPNGNMSSFWGLGGMPPLGQGPESMPAGFPAMAPVPPMQPPAQPPAPTYTGPQEILEIRSLGPFQPGPQYKRGRGRSFFRDPPKKGAICQVPGCDKSLHKLRDYYKRYKICPFHLELPCLVVEGQSIRFCQQCGRYQLLSDFDGDRRSCRRKLVKHNARRRKPENPAGDVVSAAAAAAAAAVAAAAGPILEQLAASGGGGPTQLQQLQQLPPTGGPQQLQQLSPTGGDAQQAAMAQQQQQQMQRRYSNELSESEDEGTSARQRGGGIARSAWTGDPGASVGAVSSGGSRAIRSNGALPPDMSPSLARALMNATDEQLWNIPPHLLQNLHEMAMSGGAPSGLGGLSNMSGMPPPSDWTGPSFSQQTASFGPPPYPSSFGSPPMQPPLLPPMRPRPHPGDPHGLPMGMPPPEYRGPHMLQRGIGDPRGPGPSLPPFLQGPPGQHPSQQAKQQQQPLPALLAIQARAAAEQAALEARQQPKQPEAGASSDNPALQALQQLQQMAGRQPQPPLLKSHPAGPPGLESGPRERQGSGETSTGGSRGAAAARPPSRLASVFMDQLSQPQQRQLEQLEALQQLHRQKQQQQQQQQQQGSLPRQEPPMPQPKAEQEEGLERGLLGAEPRLEASPPTSMQQPHAPARSRELWAEEGSPSTGGPSQQQPRSQRQQPPEKNAQEEYAAPGGSPDGGPASEGCKEPLAGGPSREENGWSPKRKRASSMLSGEEVSAKRPERVYSPTAPMQQPLPPLPRRGSSGSEEAKPGFSSWSEGKPPAALAACSHSHSPADEQGELGPSAPKPAASAPPLSATRPVKQAELRALLAAEPPRVDMPPLPLPSTSPTGSRELQAEQAQPPPQQQQQQQQRVSRGPSPAQEQAPAPKERSKEGSGRCSDPSSKELASSLGLSHGQPTPSIDGTPRAPSSEGHRLNGQANAAPPPMLFHQHWGSARQVAASGSAFTRVPPSASLRQQQEPYPPGAMPAGPGTQPYMAHSSALMAGSGPPLSGPQRSGGYGPPLPALMAGSGPPLSGPHGAGAYGPPLPANQGSQGAYVTQHWGSARARSSSLGLPGPPAGHWGPPPPYPMPGPSSHGMHGGPPPQWGGLPGGMGQQHPLLLHPQQGPPMMRGPPVGGLPPSNMPALTRIAAAAAAAQQPGGPSQATWEAAMQLVQAAASERDPRAAAQLLLQQQVPGGGDSSVALSPELLRDAVGLLQQVLANSSAEAYQPNERVVTISLKLYQMTPDQLPPDLRKELEAWLARCPTLLEGSMRPGCVHVTLSALLEDREASQLQSDFQSSVHRLLSRRDNGSVGASLQGSVLAQCGRDAVVLKSSGEVLASLDLASSSMLIPKLSAAQPLAVTPGYKDSFLITGRHISDSQDQVFVRHGGGFPMLEVLGKGESTKDRPEGPMEWVEFRIPDLQVGSHQIEAQRGRFVGARQLAFAVLPDEEAVQELRQLETDCKGIKDIPGFVQQVGLVAHHLQATGRLGCAAPHTPAEAYYNPGLPSIFRLRRKQCAAAAAAGCSAGAAGVWLEAQEQCRKQFQAQFHEPRVAQRVARVAQQLGVACVLRRWPALLRLVLPAVTAGGQLSPQEAVTAMDALLEPKGATLLHAAAGVGCLKTLGVLKQWGEAVGHSWGVDAAGPGGITPLHLLAILRDCGELAVAVTELVPHGHKLWSSACAARGVSPLELVSVLGNRKLLQALAFRGKVPGARLMLSVLTPSREHRSLSARSINICSADSGCAATAAGVASPQQEGELAESIQAAEKREQGEGEKDATCCSAPQSWWLTSDWGSEPDSPTRFQEEVVSSDGGSCKPCPCPSGALPPTLQLSLPGAMPIAPGSLKFCASSLERRFSWFYGCKMRKVDTVAYLLLLVLQVHFLWCQHRQAPSWLSSSLTCLAAWAPALVLLPAMWYHRTQQWYVTNRDGLVMGVHFLIAMWQHLTYWQPDRLSSWAAAAGRGAVVWGVLPSAVWSLVALLLLQVRFMHYCPLALALATMNATVLLPRHCDSKYLDVTFPELQCAAEVWVTLCMLSAAFPMLLEYQLEMRMRHGFHQLHAPGPACKAGLEHAKQARLSPTVGWGPLWSGNLEQKVANSEDFLSSSACLLRPRWGEVLGSFFICCGIVRPAVGWRCTVFWHMVLISVSSHLEVALPHCTCLVCMH